MRCHLYTAAYPVCMQVCLMVAGDALVPHKTVHMSAGCFFCCKRGSWSSHVNCREAPDTPQHLPACCSQLQEVDLCMEALNHPLPPQVGGASAPLARPSTSSAACMRKAHSAAC